MAEWSTAQSGGRDYTIENKGPGQVEVRRNDGFNMASGTHLGTVGSTADAISTIKADSGDQKVDVKPY